MILPQLTLFPVYRARHRSGSALALIALVLVSWTVPVEAKRQRLRRRIRVRAINVEVKNVFDPSVPGENYWPYRLANIVHIRTRAAIIRRELLVRPGEDVTQELIEESERDLRSLPFIKDARVTEAPVGPDEVDLLVRTQDSWTTQPQVNFGSEGGQSHFSAGILEENLFGYGKTFSYFYRSNPDGVTHEFGYGDPQLLGTRWRLNSLFLDTPTGNEQHVNIERPFYSYQTRYAGGVNLDKTLGLQKVYQGGVETTRYDLRHFNVSPFAGVRVNEDILNPQRLIVHYRYSEDVYRAEPETAPGTLPAAKALSGPQLIWTLQQSDFIKETFADTAERIEDFNLGHETAIGAGYSTRALGATSNTVPFTVQDAFGFGGDGPWFGITTYGVAGRYATYADGQMGGRLANALYYGNMSLYRHWLPEFPLTGVAHFEAAHLQNGDTSNVLSLGGDTGLRGFKNNSFTGNKSLLMNLENRFFYPYEVLHLAYVGGAVFFDAGQTQPEGLGFDRKQFHADIGAGLRFALTRSTAGTVYRVDVAYALGPISSQNRVIVSISSGVGFQRTGNTYAGFTDIQTR